MTFEENVRAILESNFAGIKDEIIETACERICELTKDKDYEPEYISQKITYLHHSLRNNPLYPTDHPERFEWHLGYRTLAMINELSPSNPYPIGVDRPLFGIKVVPDMSNADKVRLLWDITEDL